MEGHNETNLSIPFSPPINIINNIKFSSREIDILACVVGGRTAKKIASFLSLSPRTVENHIRNIMLKLERNSRESLIDFIEQSDKFFLIKDYYLTLLVLAEFEKSLKEISKLSSKENLRYLLVYEENNKSKKAFICFLQKHLKLAGLTETEKKITPFFQNNIVLQVEKESLNQIASSVKKTFALFLEREDSKAILKELTEFDDEEIIKEKNYYFLVFEVLKKLLPQLNLEKIISEFKKKYNFINSSHKSNFFLTSSNQQGHENKKTFVQFAVLFLFKIKKWKIFSAILIIGLVSIGLLGIRKIQEDKESKNYTQAHHQRKPESESIRSDFAIPVEVAFLHRPELLVQIDEAFKGNERIQVVALMGIGGSGKTTLARQYARQQKVPLIWEINAETQESLKSSFEDLAQAVAKTEEAQRVLRELLDINTPTEKEKKILEFVKQHLLDSTSWFLIFDNVKTFTDLQNYFPQDFNTWGQGKVILTTRNMNIQNNKHLNHSLSIRELNDNQKLTLLTKIMHHGTKDSFTDAQKEEAKKFLKTIPPFPLDVSVASYYIRATHVSYNQYLEELNKSNPDFTSMQENILKETGEYTKTRYSIITLSLQKLIETHENFADLLLFISLLDSQNIPKELLDRYKNPSIVNNFLYNLKKHSIVTTQSSPFSTESAIFLHRNTQNIILSYLTELLKLNKNSQLLKRIVDILDDYLDHILEQEDFSKIRLMAQHIEKFLHHSTLLSELFKGLLESKLGSIYYFIHADKSYQILENSLKTLNRKSLEHLSSEDHSRLARSFLHIGAVYTELRLERDAQEVLKKAIAMYDKEGSKNYVDLSWALSHLGNVHRRLGDYDKARGYLEESIRLHKQYGVDKKRIARTLAYMGGVYRGLLGFHQKAIKSLEESLALYNKNFPNDHFRIGWILTQLGNLYRDLGDGSKAKKYFEDSLFILKKHLPENHISIGLALAYLGNCYRELSEYGKSRDYLERSLKIHQKHFNENHVRMGWILFHLASTYKALGYQEEAQKLFDKVFEIYANHCGEDSIKTVRLLRNMAEISIEKNRLDDAENFIKRSLKILQSRNHVNTYRSLEILGEIYQKKSTQLSYTKNSQEHQNLKNLAIDAFNQALKITEQHFSKNSVHIERLRSKIKCVQE